MTTAELRAALDNAGYADAEIRSGMVHIRDADAVKTYHDHRAALKQHGIPVAWGGWNIGGVDRAGWYWVAVKGITP